MPTRGPGRRCAFAFLFVVQLLRGFRGESRKLGVEHLGIFVAHFEHLRQPAQEHNEVLATQHVDVQQFRAPGSRK
jgi:hypothetical protein